MKHGAKVEAARSAMRFIDQAAREGGAEKHPRSVSLIQFTLGTLVQAGLITGAVKCYVPLITPELIDLYPKAALLGDGFQFGAPE